MPLSKRRRSPPLRISTSPTPSRPSLDRYTLAPLPISRKSLGSFGRWSREQKGKQRALGPWESGNGGLEEFGIAAARTGSMQTGDRSRARRSSEESHVERQARPSTCTAARFDVSGPSNTSRSTTSFSDDSVARLSRSMSLLSSETHGTTTSSHDHFVPPVPTPRTAHPHRKLVKRHPSGPRPQNSRPRRSVVNLSGPDIPPPSFTLTYHSSSAFLPAGAGPALIHPDPSSTSALFRNGSSSTTASSSDQPTSEESSGGLVTPHDFVPASSDRESFGAGWVDVHRAWSTASVESFYPGDDLGPPRLLDIDVETASAGHSYSSKTSSSGRTVHPRQPISPLLFDIPIPSVTPRDYHKQPEPETTAGLARRKPSVYDLEEILRLNTPLSNSVVWAEGTRRQIQASTSETACSTVGTTVGGPSMEAQCGGSALDGERSMSAPPRLTNGPRSQSCRSPSYHTRPAPVPPHLAPLSPIFRANSQSKTTSSPRLAQIEGLPCPAKHPGLTALLRRMSYKGSSSSGHTDTLSVDASVESGDLGDGEKKVKVKRPGLMRSLSRRRTVPDGEKENEEEVPPLPVPRALPKMASERPPAPAIPALPTSGPTNSVSSAGPSRLQSALRKTPSPPADLHPRRPSLPIALATAPTLESLRIDFADTTAPLTASPSEIIPSTSFKHVASSSARESKSERKRRFRRTLVEIEDDLQFHKLLQAAELIGPVDTPGLDESMQACCGEDGQLGMSWVTPVKGEEGEKLSPPIEELSGEDIRNKSVQAWFVTRELVQGEKRHGKLLSRGISIVTAFAERSGPEMSTSNRGKRSEPTTPATPAFATPATTPTRRLSKLAFGGSSAQPRRTPSHARFPSVRQTHASTPSLRLSDYSSSSALHLPSTPESSSPIEILLRRLPRLLGLSLTLSSRFAHDPQPEQVATAFLSMEVDLLLELSEWAGEVGKLIAMGFGELLDREMRDDASLSRLSRSPTILDIGAFSEPSDGKTPPTTAGSASASAEKEDRMSFSEVLLGPIQRAARYRLLFHSLVVKMPNGSHGREKVQAALWASERILQGVNRGQGFDLEALRRGSLAEQGAEGEGAVLIPRKKGSKGRRVKSMYS